MKIQTEYPYEEYNGYIVINKENRRMVCLVHKTTKQRTTISYSRYLISVNKKRLLTKEEQVDHIDGDKSNDNIENLQILSLVENNRKRIKEKNMGLKRVEMKCPVCEKIFTRDYRNTHFQKKGHVDTCSKKCLYDLLRRKLSIDVLKEFGKNQLVREFRNGDVSSQAYTL